MTDTVFTPTPVQEVNQQEIGVATAGPAVLTNRFYINVSPMGVRIAFAEQEGLLVPAFRTAVVMSFQDAYALSSVIKQLRDANVHVVPQDPAGQQEAPTVG